MMSAIRNWAGKAAVLLLPITLGACAQYAQQYSMTTSAPSGQGPLAWDGAGRDPNLGPSQRHARKASPAVAETTDAQDPLTADTDAQLARKLVICSTCIKPAATQSSEQQGVTSLASRQ
ncbi:hypothetical protein JQ633_12360 [Bradyrhizobium tropiciagri]|uniref:hypothetical protein n=1 Tax=Bradyrhizobium tropiciagri TaxID=312253 RepID=UPI001BAAC452|nr:hypothetical protein [Bradyrhizobium tropiciagri]MBR0871157.1 hypothetical protein [Bradyrhizobium tropiciagri]